MQHDVPRLLLVDDGEDYAALLPARLPEFRLIDPGLGPLPRIPDGPTALSWLGARFEF